MRALLILCAVASSGCGRPPADQDAICASPAAWEKFGTENICRAVRKQQREGVELFECVKDDGKTYCIMIDRRRGDAD